MRRFRLLSPLGAGLASAVVGAMLALAVGLPIVASRDAGGLADFDGDSRGLKERDLERAIANGGVSPDRLVVTYADLREPVRSAVLAAVGGRRLVTDAALKLDVVRVPGGDAPALVERVRSVRGVADVHPDYVGSLAQTGDPLAAGPYGSWGVLKVQAPAVWPRSQGAGVRVAVLDCGIYDRHPDLAGKLAASTNFSSSPSVSDLCDHGTHVAGIIAALTNNGLGVASVAPGAMLLNVKVVGDKGSGLFSDFERGIRWAADNGARVINMSVGSDIPCPPSTQQAIDYAASKGAVVVAAAGNSGASHAEAPASCANVIAVAATGADDTRASFSNVGPGVALAAPGVAVVSTVNPDLNKGTLFAPRSGTSMAAPHVSGVAALVVSSAPGAGPDAVRSKLLSGADPVPGTGQFWRYGRVNAARALGVEMAAPSPAPLPAVSVSVPVPAPRADADPPVALGEETATTPGDGAAPPPEQEGVPSLDGGQADPVPAADEAAGASLAVRGGSAGVPGPSEPGRGGVLAVPPPAQTAGALWGPASTDSTSAPIQPGGLRGGSATPPGGSQLPERDAPTQPAAPEAQTGTGSWGTPVPRDAPPPPPPPALRIRAVPGGIALDWDPPADVEQVTYNVYRGVSLSTMQPIAAGTRTTQFVDRAVQPDVRYVYYVTAQNQARRESGPSPVARLP